METGFVFPLFSLWQLKGRERQCMQPCEHVDDILVWTHQVEKHSKFSYYLRIFQTGNKLAVTQSLTFCHRTTHCNSTPYLEVTYSKQQKRNETVFSLCSYWSIYSIETCCGCKAICVGCDDWCVGSHQHLLCYELRSLLHYRGPGFCSLCIINCGEVVAQHMSFFRISNM
jgi:hypothetical protein